MNDQPPDFIPGVREATEPPDAGPPERNEPKNIYLDFERNRDALSGQVRRILACQDKVLFPDQSIRSNEDPLNRVIETVFPEGWPSTYFVSNTSLQEGWVNLVLRPKIEGPALVATFPKGISLAFGGWLRGKDLKTEEFNLKNPVFEVQKIVDLADCPARPFEVEIICRAFHSEESLRRRRNNLFTTEFVTALPLISVTTRDNLVQWRDYLKWWEEIIRAKQVGLRYLDVEITAKGPVFTVVAQNEPSFKQARKLLNRAEEGCRALDLRCSADAWRFRNNPENRIPIWRFPEVGHLEEVAPAQVTPILLEDCPWEQPWVVSLRSEFNDEDREAIKAAGQQDMPEVCARLRGRFPREGFIATASVGEWSLLQRQRQAVNDFICPTAKRAEFSCYAPFLNYWLFDITRANVPAELPAIEKWHNPQIAQNERQQEAVKKMLAAPDVCLIQGPPGTGKTTVIAEAICQFVERGNKVLLASQANIAVDNALGRLGSNPRVRPISFAKTEDRDKQRFTEEAVLGEFYRSVAKACRKKFLEQWEEQDSRLRICRTWLREAEFLATELKRQQEQAAELRRSSESLDAEAETERVRMEGEKQRFAERLREREQLRRFAEFLRVGESGDFVLPAPCLSVAEEGLCQPLAQLEELGIGIRLHLLNVSNSPAERTQVVRETLAQWRRLTAQKFRLRQDRERVANGVVSFDIKAHDQHQELEDDIKRLEAAMLAGDQSVIDHWRVKRRKLNELNSGILLDAELYSAIFRINECWKSLCAPGADRNAVVNHLSKTLERIEALEGTIAQAQTELMARLNRQLEEPIEEPGVGSRLEELQASQRRMEAERERNADALQVLQDRLRSHMRAITGGNQEQDRGLARLEEVQIQVQKETERLAAEASRNEAVRRELEPLLREWTSLLGDEKRSLEDQDHFLGTYLENCNVIGFPCNHNRNVLREHKHLSFDVAMIDEVSKATPPELLMPMMSAKKVVLVGDHRQLPPVFSQQNDSFVQEAISWQEAFEQEAEENDAETGEGVLSVDQFPKFERMVTSSLFKEYFERAPDLIRASLTKQFRMHSDIMAVINHFYEQRLEMDAATLDPLRAHGLLINSEDGLPLITPERHVLWVDSSTDPCGRRHWEDRFQQNQRGRSKENSLEVALIVAMIEKIQGFYTQHPSEGKVEVGVISFYRGQVRRLRRGINKSRYPSLDIEINTVDAFQGKEKRVVLVSLVRNKPSGRTDSKAFVAQFERINVAFSRASHLLLIFGATQMFQDCEVQMPKMDGLGQTTQRVYKSIIDEIKRKGGWILSRAVISPRKYEPNAHSARPNSHRVPRP
ncbi:MAG: AAA family ATPase [Verrucomicrobia bacterium]|nr:AAA family ATPase [Verrucomicrobiota bacterium]